jgi:tetratricopeptide (TPR) repeat protein
MEEAKMNEEKPDGDFCIMAIDCFNRALILLKNDKIDLIALCHCLKGKIYLEGLKQKEKAIKSFSDCIEHVRNAIEESKNEIF